MSSVTSKDGTSIAYERQGSGPAVILVTGNLDDGAENAPIAAELAPRFTVYNYNRRGRGDSGDTLPYALEREIEDLDALIAEAGGHAHLYGVSSGGALVLQAAAAGLSADRIVVYEVPYLVGEDMRTYWREYVRQLGPALAEGRNGDAVALFMRLAGSSEEEIEGARRSPYWPGVERLAPTLAYDAAALGDGPPPVSRLAAITQPTLVATGGGQEMFEQAADVIAEIIPGARRAVVQQGHVVDAKLFAPEVERFLQG